MTNSLKPTFSNWKDRVTYLASESQALAVVLVLIATAAVGFLIWLYTVGGWDVPGWMWSFIGGASLLFLPLAVVMYLIFKRFKEDNTYRVYEIDANPRGGGVTTWDVPPEDWEERREVQFPAYQVGDAHIVRSFDWQEDLGQIVVEGVYLAKLSPDKLLTLERYISDVHEQLLAKHFELAARRDRTGTMAAQMQEETVNAMAEARENGTMMDQTAVQDAWKDAAREMDDAADLNNLPDPAEYDDGAPDLDDGARAEDENEA